jgi:hypothetical protein
MEHPVDDLVVERAEEAAKDATDGDEEEAAEVVANGDAADVE